MMKSNGWILKNIKRSQSVLHFNFVHQLSHCNVLLNKTDGEFLVISSFTYRSTFEILQSRFFTTQQRHKKEKTRPGIIQDDHNIKFSVWPKKVVTNWFLIFVALMFHSWYLFTFRDHTNRIEIHNWCGCNEWKLHHV